MTISFIASMVIYALVGVLALFGALLGFFRGVRRATFRLLTVGVSAVIAYFLAKAVFPICMSFFAGKTPMDLLTAFGVTASEDVANILASVDIVFFEYAVAIPLTMLIVPLFFLIIFMLVSGLMIIVHKIFSGMLGFTRKNNNIVTRLLGMAVGIVQGALVALVILVPVIGVMNLCDDTLAETEKTYPDRANTEVVEELYASVAADTKESNFVYKLAGGACSAIYDSFLQVNIEGEDIDMRDIVGSSFDIFVLIGDLSETHWAELTDADKFAINQIVDVCEDTRYMRNLTSSAFKTIGLALDNGAVEVKITEPFDVIFHDLVGVLETSDESNVVGDLETIKEVYYVVSDNGTFAVPYEDSKQMFDSLLKIDETGRSVFGRINETFSRNERMAIMATHLSEISMEIMLKASGIDNPDTAKTIENVKGGLEDVLAIDKESYETEEEYKEDVSSKIDETLKENDISIDEEQLSQITDYVIEELEGKENVTDAEIADFMAKYYDTYKQSGEIEIPPEV